MRDDIFVNSNYILSLHFVQYDVFLKASIFFRFGGEDALKYREEPASVKKHSPTFGFQKRIFRMRKARFCAVGGVPMGLL